MTYRVILEVILCLIVLEELEQQKLFFKQPFT